MKQKLFLPFLVAAVVLTACSKPVTRKVVVMGRGSIAVADNNITVKDGTGYVEEKINIEGNAPAKFEVTTPQGKSTITVPEEKGVYILNLKTDTIVGSLQQIGVDLSRKGIITQEELKIRIDSLNHLLVGDNVNLGGINFFIIPGQIIKISPNINARIFGPYTLISSPLEAEEDGSAPEIYKFYTNSEMRQQIQRLIKQTLAP